VAEVDATLPGMLLPQMIARLERVLRDWEDTL
jgi:hypothetical protein